MSPLLAPLLAQLVTLEAGARTEARYVGYNGDTRAEATTAPRVGVGIRRRRTSFGVAYTPALTVSPLDRDARALYVFHQAGAVAGHSFRRTTLGVAGGYAAGSRLFNLVGVQGLLPPVTPTPTPGGVPTTPATPGVPTTPGMPTTPGTPTTPGGSPTTAPSATGNLEGDQRIRYYTWTVTGSATHRFSKELQLTATGGTMTSKGADDPSRYVVGDYRSYFLGGSGGYTYTKSKQDSFVSSLSLYKVWSNAAEASLRTARDYEAATANASETWLHRLDDRTSTTLGVGMNVTRFSQDDGLAGISIWPTLQAGVSHRQKLNGGTLTLSANTYSAPVVDPLRATVDPRVGVGGVANYVRDKVSLTATTNVALSLAPNDRRDTALNSVFAEGRAAYSLGKLTLVDTGARIARQTYGGQNVVPLSWAVFVALTFGASTTLIR